MRTIVVLPTYNEAEGLVRLAEELLSFPDLSMLIVDDNSPDGTGAIADRLAERFLGRVAVMHRSGKLGLASAYIDGFREVLRDGADFIVQMDADFSHPPADVPRLVGALVNADVAIGSRYVPGAQLVDWPFIRRIVSRGGSIYTRAILGLPLHDPTSGFKCFRRAALASLNFDLVKARGFGFMVEVNWHCVRRGLRIVEVPICFQDRKQGQSKMSARIFFEAMVLVWRMRLSAGSVTR